MSAFLGEVFGTMILIIFGGGVVAGSLLKKSKAENSGWVVISIGWGLGVAIAAYSVGGFSGAHLNPALTLGLATIGEFAWADVPLYIVAQLIGAIIGAVIVFFAYSAHWGITNDANLKLAVFSTAPAVRNPAANVATEVIGTFALVLGILAIGANEFTEGLNPLIVGALVIGIGMSLGGPTGYAINPARDLGPRIAHFFLPIPGKRDSDWSYSWVPVVGPILGGVFGALFYKQFFLGENTVAFWIALVAVLCVFIFAYNSMAKSRA
ncbi:MIP/aquaporin family protein [Solibacillus sp. CAU 1738]|uniref:MIP/aquaporin family protein n=1 Tax=Solibacillus sp. CAU 1738 TaxID=3140363 RepID=UPI0032608D4D